MMEKKWTYCAVYSIIQIHFVRGVWEEAFSAGEDIYALPGSDVNLTCQTQKKGSLVQMQWSKITQKVDLIALYHPQHGFYCANGVPCTSHVAFTETPGNVSRWTLHLRNMSPSLSGKYECSFTLFPEGIQTKIYNLLIQTNVIPDEWTSNNTIETEVNRTLEIPCFQNISSEISSEFTFSWLVKIFTCSLRNVFPTANLTWFIGGSIPQGESKELCITNAGRKDKNGFFELKSVLKTVYGNKPAQSNNLTIWCMALFPVPGNKVWNSSSKKITFSLGSVNPPTDPALSVTESTFDTQPSPANSISPTRYPATSSVTLVNTSTSTPNTAAQTSNSNVTTQGFNYSWTSSGKDTKNSSSIPSETSSSSPSSAGATLYGDVFTNTTKAFSEVPTTANGSTKNNYIHITGIVTKTKDGMSWPVIVAALLFFCLSLFGLGVRKWCQYQKEIMERPPPFKPPPPPIKYTCIQESIGNDLPFHEMETL
ncbi:T-cell surface protein tactile isoform X2 [Rhinolophus sinicus]|uniref:T-cell surface protein tactile isoform X2 n=1 Tax=Rhinolophus sinicus TaxID=89399 RepID=UPI003D7A362D